MRLEEFLENPTDKRDKGTQAYILFDHNIYPKSPYRLLVAGRNVDWEKEGFVLEDGKLKRDGRIYYSPEMNQIEELFNSNGVKFDFYPPKKERDVGTLPLPDGNTLMIVKGEELTSSLFENELFENAKVYIF